MLKGLKAKQKTKKYRQYVNKKYLFEAELLVALPPLSGEGGVPPLPLKELRLLNLLLVGMPPGLVQHPRRKKRMKPGKVR